MEGGGILRASHFVFKEWKTAKSLMSALRLPWKAREKRDGCIGLRDGCIGLRDGNVRSKSKIMPATYCFHKREGVIW
jgi:hypothetical protein